MSQYESEIWVTLFVKNEKKKCKQKRKSHPEVNGKRPEKRKKQVGSKEKNLQ